MLYQFIKDKGGNVIRIGEIDAQELEVTAKRFYADGYTDAQASEYDEQVIGVLNKTVEDLQKTIAGLQPAAPTVPAADAPAAPEAPVDPAAPVDPSANATGNE
jgi:hypothetical protein